MLVEERVDARLSICDGVGFRCSRGSDDLSVLSEAQVFGRNIPDGLPVAQFAFATPATDSGTAFVDGKREPWLAFHSLAHTDQASAHLWDARRSRAWGVAGFASGSRKTTKPQVARPAALRAALGNRTPDLLITSETLYRLS